MSENKNILSEIDFFLENKDFYTKEEREEIKKTLRKALKNIGNSVINFIDSENNR